MLRNIPLSTIVCVVFNFFGFTLSLEPNWSVCDQAFYGNCWNGVASDDGQFSDLKPISVSVKGLYVFFVNGVDETKTSGLAEFVFQERVNDYHLLDLETRGKISFLKRIGDYDYHSPAITLVNELSLISNGFTRIYETSGWDSTGNCTLSATFPTKSLAISGAEGWELLGKINGISGSICIQVQNTTSFIPGIIRDVRELGFEHELGNICGVLRGCSKTSEIIRIPNTQTSGVLHR